MENMTPVYDLLLYMYLWNIYFKFLKKIPILEAFQYMQSILI